MEAKISVVSFAAFESMKSTMERTIKRLWILLIIVLVLFVGSNVAWIYYENSFTDTVVTQDVETGEGDAVVTGIGDIYGESKADSKEENP